MNDSRNKDRDSDIQGSKSLFIYIRPSTRAAVKYFVVRFTCPGTPNNVPLESDMCVSLYVNASARIFFSEKANPLLDEAEN
jgi:hypothetical protein